MKSNKWLLSLAVGFLCCGSAYSQTTVKGTITSESGEPLIGATITVKNSTDGTVTDIDGNYSLKTKKTLSSKDLLLFSYVGYKTLQKNYTGNTMNVKLAEESQQLNDVVVTALGIKRGEKGWNDPRLQVYATQVTLPDQTKDYVGLPSGYQTLPSITASGLNQEMAKAPMKLAMMPYAEVEFIKAELLKKGVIDGGSNAAKEAYQKGVQAAIEQWGQVLPDNYFENPEAAYDDTLERIMNQKFVALFFCDYQQWFEYNRTGFPVLPVGPGIANANNQMPKRFKYPAALQRTNLKNYQAAKQNMGGDDFNIRLMWQQ